MSWSDWPVHNGWLASIVIDGRTLSTGRATKRNEAKQRAMANLLVRLEAHPPTR